MNGKFNKNAKAEKFTNMLGIAVRLIVIDPLAYLCSDVVVVSFAWYVHNTTCNLVIFIPMILSHSDQRSYVVRPRFPFLFTGAYALGAIDPSLYKIVDEDDDYDIPADHIGRVWFAVEYERETEKLLVTLIKAKNLPTRQYGNNSSCDPFIR